MRKKELLKLIKTKSEEINIKDFSAAIVEKARLLPQSEAIIRPKRKFYFKPSLMYSFTLVTAVVAFFFLYNPASPIVPQIEDVNQVVALSSVTAVSLIEFDTTLIDQNNTTYLSLDYVTLDVPVTTQIDEEIDDVTMYLGTMEKLLNSDDDFNYQMNTTTIDGYNNHLSFTAKDMLDQETDYTFNFNQVENQTDNQFTLQGTIEIDGIHYMVTAQGALNNPQQLQLHIEKDANNYIDINYEVTETTSRYQISVVENGTQLQSTNMVVKEINNRRSVYLDFIDGQSTGSYAFRLTEENQMRRMNISYYISGDTSESGEIDVTVDTTGATSQYAIEIRPQGRMPYMIEKDRGMNYHGGGPSSSLPGVSYI
ncbi:MAG: hypothetical protein KKH01_08975 [Firmicutes bacterium]|nr:hypothetical protein [Bacillota bacterium]